jgi:hypothetical protein
MLRDSKNPENRNSTLLGDRRVFQEEVSRGVSYFKLAEAQGMRLLLILGGARPSPHNFPVRHSPMEGFSRMLFAILLDPMIDSGIHDWLADECLSEIIIRFLGRVGVAYASPIPVTLVLLVTDARGGHVLAPDRRDRFDRLDPARLSRHGAVPHR